MKEYGILYGKPLFKKGHKLEWLNYSNLQMPVFLVDRVKEMLESINDIYSDNIIIPLDISLSPGVVANTNVIEEIANLVYNGFNIIFKDLIDEDNCYILVWSIGEMDSVDELIKQGKRVKETPTLHNVDPYPIIIKVGTKLDNLKEPGIYKI